MDGENGTAIAASKSMQSYFQQLQQDIDQCYELSNEARRKGLDPALNVEIPQARDLAQRVEELVGPKHIAPVIREVTKELGNRELVSLELARYIANGDNYQFNNTEQALDQAIRTGLAILTEGVLVAPLEGIADVKLGSNSDGSTYVDLFFSGPIRSAGGTGQAMSVLIADVVRRELGIGSYIPTKNEIERYKEEIPLYKRVQHLQYTPTVDEIDLIVSKCPICIDGEGTEQEEITGNRDLPRVETNRLRGGACLVIAEGLCLKAPKLMKHISNLNLEGWDFLDVFVNKNKNESPEDEGQMQENCIPAILPSTKYIKEVIAGRPVFSHPSRKGGFRLRYGRARTAGLASTAIHPSSMFLFNEFIAIGTQMKMERPGKATIGTPCSTIDPPMALTYGEDLIELPDPSVIDYAAVKEIIDAGEILIPYGEFLENNALLPNASYSYEWWIQELQEKLGLLPKKNIADAVRDADQQTHHQIHELLGESIDLAHPSFSQARIISETYGIPLHPNYTLFWHDIILDDVYQLATFLLGNATYQNDRLVIPYDKEIKKILIELGTLHKKHDNKVIIEKYAEALPFCLGLKRDDDHLIKTDRFKVLETIEKNQYPSTNRLITQLAGIEIQEKAPFRIGTRMGRPEKAAERKMRPPPHVLFPLGNYGSNQRLFTKAAEHSPIDVEAGKRECTVCGKTSFRLICTCGGHTVPIEDRIETYSINVTKELADAKKRLHLRNIPDTIKGVQGTISKHKTPEPIEKGILRAKHGVSVFKDGTIRFDMTDAPLTHFKPQEIHVSLDRIKKLGYTNDYQQQLLERDDQICELKVQDVVISQACAEYFMKTANFVDELLVRYYNMKPYYSLKKIEDLTGHLVIGLAPHTSGGSLGRIIGFTDAQVCFSHPFYHAAKRRNCVDSKTTVVILNDNKPVLESIEELYERINSDECVVDDFQTKRKTVSNIQAFAFSKEKKTLRTQEISGIYKAKSPKHLLNIQLKSGRSLVVSPYHRCLVVNKRKTIVKKALELDKNDLFLISKHNDFESSDVKQLDLLLIFSQYMELSKDVVVRNTNVLVKNLVDMQGGLKSTAKKLGLNRKTFSNYIYRDSIPLNILSSLLILNSLKLSDVSPNVKLSMKREKISIPRFIDVDKWFMKLIGYYLAEGHARCIPKNYYHICFACSEQELKNEIEECISKVFRINYYKTHRDITISNRIIYLFFTQFLSLGKNASEKRLPSLLAMLPKKKIKYLLKAYFSGDGSVEKGKLHVTCSSIHKEFLEDIGFQLSRFEIFYQIKYERRPSNGAVKTFYEKHGKKSESFHLYYLSIRSTYARIFHDQIGFSLYRKQKRLASVINKERKPRIEEFGDYLLDPIKNISVVQSLSNYVYDLEVENDHNFQLNDSIVTNNCDGDEDGLMLLMDALLNFSHEYIPDKRGGKMDLPLILTTRLDPSEVDKEAHNVDCLSRYPLEFYQATLRHEHPKTLEDKMDVVGSRLGTFLQYEQFGFTHDTVDISQGPLMSRYKTLKTMMDKMNAQLNLAAKIRAVDEADVAYKVIERHFLPDILGNLRAFSKQSVRCPTCNITYRRIPLSGICRKCSGKLILTVHEKSVKKYLEISKEIADRYHIPWYAHQRINLVEKNLDSLFSSDRIRKTKLTDFF